MKRVTFYKGSIAAGSLAPFLALAQPSLIEGGAGDFGTFISGIITLINNYLIPLMVALAVLVFIYGVFKYFILGGADEEARAQGRGLMLYAIIGFVAIVALWAIVAFVASAIGLEVGAGPLPLPGAPMAN